MYLTNNLYLSDLNRISCFDSSFLNNKKIFITGASGLIGSCFIDFLVFLNLYKSANIKIYPLFSNYTSFVNRFKSYTKYDFFKPIIHDINLLCNIDFSPDFILHAAANTHPKLYLSKPVETFNTNLLGTKNVLNLVKSNNSKCVFLSSFEVYGENSQPVPLTEDYCGIVDFNKIRSCYPISKIAAETLCRSYVYQFKSNVSILRLGYIYGPTVNLQSSKADVQFLNSALIGSDIVLLSSGSQQRSYCYVFDVITAILSLLQTGESGEAYNVSSPDGNITLKRFASILSELAKVNLVIKNQLNLDNFQYSIMSSQKIQKLGWKSSFYIKEAIWHTYLIKKSFLEEKKDSYHSII